MVRAPATIRTALLAGFMVIFAVWLASTFYFTERLADSQARSAEIQSRFARGQELLVELCGPSGRRLPMETGTHFSLADME